MMLYVYLMYLITELVNQFTIDQSKRSVNIYETLVRVVKVNVLLSVMLRCSWINVERNECNYKG